VPPAANETEERGEAKREIQFGFLKDKVPPLPESFFDPLGQVCQGELLGNAEKTALD